MDSPVLFYVTPNIAALHTSLSKHLSSPLAQTARLNDHGYVIVKSGRPQVCGGLTRLLRARFFAHYKDNRSKRNHKTVRVKGSSAAQGCKVDEDIGLYVAGEKTLKDTHPMACALIEHIESLGHTMQAAQVPVEVEPWRVTQADWLTRDSETGELWLWEVKTGYPVGLHRKQKQFTGAHAGVDCTKLNQWHLQLLYTKRALEAAGVKVAHSRVIQIHEKKDVTPNKMKRGRGSSAFYVIDKHVPPPWTQQHAAPRQGQLPPPPAATNKALFFTKRAKTTDSDE
jgi:hypothetical protein